MSDIWGAMWSVVLKHVRANRSMCEEAEKVKLMHQTQWMAKSKALKGLSAVIFPSHALLSLASRERRALHVHPFSPLDPAAHRVIGLRLLWNCACLAIWASLNCPSSYIVPNLLISHICHDEMYRYFHTYMYAFSRCIYPIYVPWEPNPWPIGCVSCMRYQLSYRTTHVCAQH